MLEILYILSQFPNPSFSACGINIKCSILNLLCVVLSGSRQCQALSSFWSSSFPQARETLAEIPDQFLSYMKTHGIKPNPPPLKKQQSSFINPPGGPPQPGKVPSLPVACTYNVLTRGIYIHVIILIIAHLCHVVSIIVSLPQTLL